MEEKSKQKSLYWFAIFLFFFGYLKPVSRIFVSWSTKIKGKHMEQNETFTQTKKLIFLTISYKMSQTIINDDT